jgi:hypothetical protein
MSAPDPTLPNGNNLPTAPQADAAREDTLMEIHKPKPIHNWREFLKEYAIIVLGVATALAAEQAVEALHWHYRVQDAMAAIRLELHDDTAPQGYVRGAAAPCYDKQLDAIQAAIEQGRSRAEITGLIARYAPPRRTWSSNAWDSMLASGVAAHLPTDQMTKLGWIYTAIPITRTRALQERADLIALRPIRQGEDALSTSEADTMLAAIVRLRDINRSFGDGVPGALQMLAQSGIVLTAEEKGQILGDLRALYGDCVIAPPTFKGDINSQIDPDMRRAMAPARDIQSSKP